MGDELIVEVDAVAVRIGLTAKRRQKHLLVIGF
jgi:hypothetical protein